MIKKRINQTIRALLITGISAWSLLLTAQSASYGNTYIVGGSEVMIRSVEHTFRSSGLNPQPGIIGTERTSPRGCFSFMGSASWLGANDKLYIDGYVKTFMNTPFIFPIGDNDKFRPVSVSAASPANPAMAAYFGVSPSLARTSSLKGGLEPVLPTGTYSAAAVANEVLRVSTQEYWDIDGSFPAAITLTWDMDSDIATMTNGEIKLLTIVGWDGTKWVRIPSKIDIASILGGNSDLSAGSITTSANIVPNSFVVYTLASAVDVDPDRDVAVLTIAGGTTQSLILNDTTNGLQTTIGASGNSTISTVGVWPQGVTLNTSTGIVQVPKGILAGIYYLPYSLCDKSVPPHCVVDTLELTILASSKKSDTSTIVNTPITLGPVVNTIVTSIAARASNGTAVVNADGTVTYSPNKDFVGTDTVRKIICAIIGGLEKCDTTILIINVWGVYRDTTAVTNTGVAVTAGNPIKVMSGSSSSVRVLGPSRGTATVNADGTVTYTSPLGFVGFDTLWRIVCISFTDGTTKCDTSLIAIKVSGSKGVNPIGSDPSNPSSNTGVTTSAGTNVNIGPAIVAGKGSSATQTVSASHGVATVNPDGTISYKPNLGFAGTDTIKRVVCVTYPDGTVICETSYITVVVKPMTDDIANYISPNGDGINDVWDIDGILNIYPNTKAMIYNRWGNIVWRSKGTYGRAASKTNVWYGQLEDSQVKVPDGVYYYILELNDEFKNTKTGFIEVMRQ